MAGRFATLMLVLAQLVQALAVAHCHDVVEAGETTGHSVRRHFHLGGQAPCEAHANDHAERHHHERPSARQANAEHALCVGWMPPGAAPGDDAVYLSDATCARSRGDASPRLAPGLPCPRQLELPAGAAGPRLASQAHGPPVEADDGCPLYLRQHALRI